MSKLNWRLLRLEVAAVFAACMGPACLQVAPDTDVADEIFSDTELLDITDDADIDNDGTLQDTEPDSIPSHGYTGQCEGYPNAIEYGDLMSSAGFGDKPDFRYTPTNSNWLCHSADAGCYGTEALQYSFMGEDGIPAIHEIPPEIFCTRTTDWFCGYCYNELCLYPIVGRHLGGLCDWGPDAGDGFDGGEQ